MSSEIAIKVENLSKCYHIYDKPQDRLKQMLVPRLQRLAGMKQTHYAKEFWALKDVSFDVRKGETIGIIGCNGSGKSTLLQLICGTLNPTSGSITTKGRIAALLELGSGFNPEFTGKENVYLNASVLGLTSDEVEARFGAISAFADIGDFIDRPVKTYSSGMVVRLAFSVIANVDADILVIDEALAVGDAFFTQKCMRYLRNFMSTGTVLFVSHDVSSVVNLCNVGIYLSGGEIVVTGRPKFVTEKYLQDQFADTQTVNDHKTGKQEPAEVPEKNELDYRDMREEWINNSNLRNDIEVFQFEPMQDGFGTGDATISSVMLYDHLGRKLSWIVGGECVTLEIRATTSAEVYQPIIGFVLKDRLGQAIFSDNTYLAYIDQKIFVKAGNELVARFEFVMPILPSGDYSISPAIAEGTQEKHIQHQWLHDAMIVRVHASAVRLGLIGLPMKKITLEQKIK